MLNFDWKLFLIAFVVGFIYLQIGRVKLIKRKILVTETVNFLTYAKMLFFWPYYLLKKQGNCK